MIGWELSNELMSDGRPFSINKRYTYSSSDKGTLRKDLESWRSKPFSKEDFGKFDIFKLIGIPCMLGVVHTERNSKTYANITSIMRLPKGMETPKLVNAPVQFNISEFDQDVYDGFSDNLKALIAKSPEYSRIKGLDRSEPNTHDAPEMADEIPF
jgi:hypothetical protein